ncbi:MAG: hypothetical protein AAF937_01110 [Planctomycetota bacterium]
MAVNRLGGGRALWTSLGIAVSIGIVVCVNLLASSRTLRLDVTSTGQLALSPRTQQALSAAETGTEVVLAARLAGRARSGSDVRRVLDILEEIDESSSRVDSTIIDTSASGGQSEFDALVRRLADRDADAMAGAEEEVRAATASIVALGETLESLSRDLETIRERDAVRSSPDLSADLGSRAATLRATAEQIGPMAEFVERAFERDLAGRRLPDLPEARRVVVESADAIRTLLLVSSNRMSALAGVDSGDEETRNLSADLAARLLAGADEAGAVSVALQASPLPGVVRVVGALTASEALLVLGPTGVAAVAMDDLFPSRAPGAPGSDPGRRAESLVTNAMLTLDSADRPVVVVTHAGTSRVLAGGDDGPLGSLRSASGLRGVEWLEWPVALEPDRPGAIAAATADGRPVIYVVIGIDTTAQGGAERSARTAAVLADLLERGERVMVNLAPSSLPGLGESDPMAVALEPLGIDADTGRPVLSETRRGGDRLVAWEQLIVGASGEGLAGSVGGLSIALPWATVVEAELAADTANAEPLLSLGREAWGEGEWLGYWVTPPQQRPLLLEKPEPGGTRDSDAGGGVVAWQIEREDSRVMVVGSHLWLFDTVADRPAVVDGRVVQQNPGNAELFLAGIEWLAGNDGLLGRSAAAFETPTVQAIDPGRLLVIRWLLLGGLPLGVLLVGLAVRLVGG